MKRTYGSFMSHMGLALCLGLVMSTIGCCSWAAKHCEPRVVIKKEPYPVAVVLPCRKGAVPEAVTLLVQNISDTVTWGESADALVLDLQMLVRENEALRKELEACGVPLDLDLSALLPLSEE